MQVKTNIVAADSSFYVPYIRFSTQKGTQSSRTSYAQYAGWNQLIGSSYFVSSPEGYFPVQNFELVPVNNSSRSQLNIKMEAASAEHYEVEVTELGSSTTCRQALWHSEMPSRNGVSLTLDCPVIREHKYDVKLKVYRADQSFTKTTTLTVPK